jgi:hypothetical protein
MKTNHINDLNQINKIIKKQQYIQAGGMPGIVVKIGEFLLVIVMGILEFIKNTAINLFYFRYEFSTEFPFIFTTNVGEGLFFKFCWLAIKAGFFLVVFAFGGPLITLIAVGFMYKQLFEKFTELKSLDDEEKPEENNNNNTND